ncbi:hypothetical protein E4Z66_12275 [Aliishimia ponticola]|uniref:DUF1440 domain-containing protein n=1 Tax=Aliishimia ponticola TaxID=2499833 RepID=A0A4S4NCR7_9RHOB|nr:hypothetical protein [Aliishimia ponticola]THH35848.1 hypothetical protein E4Z66_12275 [Aliishimia ponticola]
MPASPPLNSIVLAGLAGELAFEAYAWLLSPVLFGVTLEPARLVTALTQMGTGIALPYGAAFALHFAIGALVFPAIVWMTHARTGLKLPLAGAVAGLGLWFVAQGLLAPVVGRSFMMGFGAYTQSSFIGHVGMAALMGGLMVWFMARFAPPRKNEVPLG